MSTELVNKHLFVTGGTGSFGNKVATLLAEEGPASITVFSRDEKKQHEMKQRYPNFKYVVGDVRNYNSVYKAIRNTKATTVFHAAALKQVPNCEDYPLEALQTNCLGAANVCEAAIECGVERVVALSTDKAVQPVNAMGMSKGLAEKVVTSQPPGTTIFCCVRYGNVAGTRGSVLPLWHKQMSQQKSLTITEPHMTRFLMNLRDSVTLVRHALKFATGGEVFVWKAPAMDLLDFVDAFKKFYGYAREISIVGRRPGEKVHETLVCDDELYRTVNEDSFITIKKTATDEKYQCKTPFSSDCAPRPNDINAMLTEAELDMEQAL